MGSRRGNRLCRGSVVGGREGVSDSLKEVYSVL